MDDSKLITTKLSEIVVDPDIQARTGIDQAAVEDYAQAIRDGAKLPPLVVFEGPYELLLADGFHRIEAYRRAGVEEVECFVEEGLKRDAILFSVGANADHGLRRTNADKRRAVEMLLADAECSTWSDRKIAEQCRVSQPFVSSIRQALKTVISAPPSAEAGANVVDLPLKRKTADGRVMDTSGISKANHRRRAKSKPKPKKPPAADVGKNEELERIKAENARLREVERELLAENEQLKEELARLDQITGSDDPMTAALEAAKEADRKRLEMERVMQARINGLLEEKAAVIRQVRALKRKYEHEVGRRR